MTRVYRNYGIPKSAKSSHNLYRNSEREEIEVGKHEDALFYEMQDMEKAVMGDREVAHLDYTKDVMEIMTGIRREWGLVYPEERNNTCFRY